MSTLSENIREGNKTRFKFRSQQNNASKLPKQIYKNSKLFIHKNKVFGEQRNTFLNKVIEVKYANL